MKNILSQIRPNILSLIPYSSARSEHTMKEGIFLDANENPYGKYNRYPDPQHILLKNKISALKSVINENLLITNGSDEFIDLSIRIFCEPGVDKILCFDPSYGMYEVSAAINNTPVIKFELNEEFQIDLDELTNVITQDQVKIIFICSPNNPTGNSFDRSTIESILNMSNAIVIVDEAYIDFSNKASMIDLIKYYDNLIICQTFSKAWGMASLRVGIAYSNPTLISVFNKVKLPYNLNAESQRLTLNALEDQENYRNILKTILKEKDLLYHELRKLECIQKIYPSDANFFLIKVKNSNSLYAYLLEKNILVRNRGNQIPNCLRISVGSKKENSELIKALKKYK